MLRLSEPIGDGWDRIAFSSSEKDNSTRQHIVEAINRLKLANGFGAASAYHFSAMRFVLQFYGV